VRTGITLRVGIVAAGPGPVAPVGRAGPGCAVGVESEGRRLIRELERRQRLDGVAHDVGGRPGQHPARRGARRTRAGQRHADAGLGRQAHPCHAGRHAPHPAPGRQRVPRRRRRRALAGDPRGEDCAWRQLVIGDELPGENRPQLG
jgi:hypothetical protein